MAPKAMTYKTNSVIYFKGDQSERVYILKSGKISLTSEDIETGQEVRDYIQTGEFFGVKSALGRYPREENALVLSDAEVVSFSVPEFEQMASQNTRIIIKMLKVFSNQLRWIHKRVQNLLNTEEQVDAETGLYNIGEHYLKKKLYAQSHYVYRRYLTYFPDGKYVKEASSKLGLAETYAQKYGNGKGPAALPGTPTQAMDRPQARSELSDVAKKYYNAVSVFSQGKYAEAMKEFKSIADAGGDEEYQVKSSYEIGRCLFQLKQYDLCIKHYTELIQKYPKMPDLPEVLFYVGQGYEAKGDGARAVNFYKKILGMVKEEDVITRKVRKALKALEDGSK
jgi:CRP-like cAMP-binding protein